MQSVSWKTVRQDVRSKACICGQGKKWIYVHLLQPSILSWAEVPPLNTYLTLQFFISFLLGFSPEVLLCFTRISGMWVGHAIEGIKAIPYVASYRLVSRAFLALRQRHSFSSLRCPGLECSNTRSPMASPPRLCLCE